MVHYNPYSYQFVAFRKLSQTFNMLRCLHFNHKRSLLIPSSTIWLRPVARPSRIPTYCLYLVRNHRHAFVHKFTEQEGEDPTDPFLELDPKSTPIVKNPTLESWTLGKEEEGGIWEIAFTHKVWGKWKGKRWWLLCIVWECIVHGPVLIQRETSNIGDEVVKLNIFWYLWLKWSALLNFPYKLW